MLRRLSNEIRECSQRAEECRRKAETAVTSEQRDVYLQIAKSWEKLARSYEFSERLVDFTNENRRRNAGHNDATTLPPVRQRSAIKSITPFLRNHVFDPETVELMASAYEQACAALGLADCGDPLNEIIAERIIELALTGIRTRTALYMLAVQDFKSNPQ